MLSLRVAARGLRTAPRALVADKWFTRQHEYAFVSDDGKTATVGITEHAAEELGDVVFVDLPESGAVRDEPSARGAVFGAAAHAVHRGAAARGGGPGRCRRARSVAAQSAAHGRKVGHLSDTVATAAMRARRRRSALRAGG